jgi:serine/threonine-protein kinase
VALAPGARLGSYEVIAPIGAGGMGEVYRARDTRLKRDVAIKVLPESFAQDPDRLARFRREAELLASLSHANIAAIYGLEQADGVTALVLELIEGETLADLISRGPLPPLEAMPIVRQLVDALEAAHEKGVIHRDLKPANIKITPDGAVKVLDFGLAKLAPIEVESAQAGGMNALSMSPTLSIHATYAGVILGTAAYMSPEQAKGRTVDKRSDVWSFGCVLFETLTGRRPFEGEDVADTIAFVLTKEPDWSLLPAHVPSAIQLLIRRCLEKDRRRRIADISTVRFVLDESTSVPSAEPAVAAAATGATPPTPRWHRLATYTAILAAGVLVTAAAAWIIARSNERTPQVSRFAIVPAAAQALNLSAPDRAIAISPDGSHIVYRGGAGNAGAGQMLVRAIDQLEPRPIAGISGFRDPFVSPDSRWIGFFTADGIRKVPITGGPSIFLSGTQGASRGASWGPDDTIVFATATTGLMSVPAAGGEPRVLTKPDTAHGETGHFFPSVLPGGAAVLFTIAAPQLENSQVAVLDLKTGQRKILIRGGSQAEYVDTGHLVYAAAGSLRAVRFDLKRLEVVSDPVPVVEQVLTTATSGEASFALSRTGTLLLVPGGVAGVEGAQRSLVWVNRQGKEEAIKAPPRSYTYPRLSPDGSRVAIDIRDQENDIWIWDLARETLTRLTFDPSTDSYPVWTPDSRRVVFASQRAGAANLYWQAADGTGTVERLTTTPNIQNPTSISHDGMRLVFFEIVPKTGADLYLLPLQGERRATPLVQTTFNERNAEISPDGAWIAYESIKSGQFQIYVQPFPNVDGGHWQVSTSAGSTRPLWARSGRELFYLSGDGTLTTVPVRTVGSTFSAGNPSKVFDTKYYGNASGTSGRTYDVSADGQRFLMIKDAPAVDQPSSATPASMIVTLNWTEELKRLSPAK